ncbi:MAG TPA: hypothetical protein PLG15_03290 [Candidatus Gastranaerophilaceae bacterium]|nr:hypothetical protein [Candidatus Gastranaerophilaceae bacterium]HPT41389.1 hypothetical protein [Candidatus Gastranaerophilaceae bacterium]
MEKVKPIVFYLIFFLFILAYCTGAGGYDYDLWARLIAGMGFVQGGHVLKQDFLSYTPTHTWFDHEWGSGVIFYLVQHFFPTAGLIVLNAVLIFILFFIITKIVNLRGVKVTTAYNFIFYLFAFLAIAINVMEPIRCQMFSFIFFALFIYILELARKGQNRPLWLLPFIMIIWNNLHGGCVSGIGLICLYILGEFLNKKMFKKYIFTLIPTILVLVINPWGFSYLNFLIDAVTMKRPDIMEWWGLFHKIHIHNFLIFKLFSLTMILTYLISSVKNFSYKNIDKTKFLILSVTLYQAIIHIKMIPFFVISATCFLYDDFYTLLDNIIKFIKQKLKIPAEFFGEKFIVKKEFAIYCFIIICSIATIHTNNLGIILKSDKFAYKEIEFLKINNIKGNLFLNFGQGSYAAYKLYPNIKIFMDGRYEEVYYNYMLPVMNEFYYSKVDNTKLMKKFPPDIMIIEKNYPVYKNLLKHKNWKLAYEGIFYGVFLNKKDLKKNYKLPSNDRKYYKKTLFDTNINFKK